MSGVSKPEQGVGFLHCLNLPVSFFRSVVLGWEEGEG